MINLRFLWLTLLTFLSTITIIYAAEDADDGRPCAVYMYPTLENIAKYQAQGLPENTELIYTVFNVERVVEVDSRLIGRLVRVMDNDLLFTMQQNFGRFKHTWLIDQGFYDPAVGVDGMQPDIIALQEALQVFRPARISTDLEPLVRGNRTDKLMLFHTQLIKEINQLGLSVSVYLACSKFKKAIGMKEYRAFQSVLVKSGNSVILDAYCWGRECKHGNECGRGRCINNGEGKCVDENPSHRCLMRKCDDTHDNYTNPESIVPCVEALIRRGIPFQLALMIVRDPTTDKKHWVYRNEDFLNSSLIRAKSGGLPEVSTLPNYTGPAFFHLLPDDSIPNPLINIGLTFATT